MTRPQRLVLISLRNKSPRTWTRVRAILCKRLLSTHEAYWMNKWIQQSTDEWLTNLRFVFFLSFRADMFRDFSICPPFMAEWRRSPVWLITKLLGVRLSPLHPEQFILDVTTLTRSTGRTSLPTME